VAAGLPALTVRARAIAITEPGSAGGDQSDHAQDRSDPETEGEWR
jgi:hypothetical protein